VSCERLFDPALNGRPVVVLSSNDGCCVSRSNEAKKIGIPMGAPYFQIRDLLRKNNGVAYSSNFALYADISDRVQTVLHRYSPNIEQYSIDEAFFYLDREKNCPLQQLAEEISTAIKQEVGVPVSVGIAPTKTLAKAMAELVKQHPDFGGGLSFFERSPEENEQLLALLPVEDVWGIGRKSAKKFAQFGIHTALDFLRADQRQIKAAMSIMGVKTSSELRGYPCFALNETPDSKKTICVSRSFGADVQEKNVLRQALTTHITQGCFTLLHQHSLAKSLMVFVIPRVHGTAHPHAYASVFHHLIPSRYPPHFFQWVEEVLGELPDGKYKKTGVIFTDISRDDGIQNTLDFPRPDRGNEFQNRNPEENEQKNAFVLNLCQKMQNQYGRRALQFCSGYAPKEKQWWAKSAMRSPLYVTSWDELPKCQLRASFA